MKKKDVNVSEAIDINIKISNKIKYNKTAKYVYKCIFFSPLMKSDCVNSMDIYDDLLIYGTIMGNVVLCHIDKNYLIPNKKLLSKENNDKNDINLKSNNDHFVLFRNRNSNDLSNDDSNEMQTDKCSNKLKNKKNIKDEKKEKILQYI